MTLQRSSLSPQEFVHGDPVASLLYQVPPHLSTVGVVDLDVIARNYRVLSQTASSAVCAPVLKADGYGMGAIPLAKRLYCEGAKVFFVAYLEEALDLWNAFQEEGSLKAFPTIYVLNGLFPGTESLFHQHGLIPVLIDEDQVYRWAKTAALSPLPAAFHVDTGMCRTGLSVESLTRFLSEPYWQKTLDIRLILSQMVYAYQENPLYSQRQKERFDQIRHLFPHVPASLAKSGPIFLDPSYHYDLVRPGIALHGLNPTGDTLELPLSPSLSVWSRICQIQRVSPGQTVGYAATFSVTRPLKVATISLGYADGFPWNMANQGHIYFGSYAAPIIGRISMDLVTVDVSHIPDGFVYSGGWAEVIGPHQPLSRLAAQANTSPYEILLRLGKRVHRLYTTN